MSVSHLKPRHGLGNIPHMLRNLADELERGDEQMPRTMFVICVGSGNAPPALFQFGDELSRLEEAGAMYACAHMALQVDES